MTLTRQSKRRIVSISSTKCTTKCAMGQTVTTCFRADELSEDHRTSPAALRTQPVALGEDKIFSILSCKKEEEKVCDNRTCKTDNRTCKKEECYSEESEDESWPDEGPWSDVEDSDSWSDDGAWSDEDDDLEKKNLIDDDLWNSFNNNCTTIPYANEFIETHITLTNVRIANEKSDQTYSSITQVTRSSSMKKVQFCPEPNLVTVITQS